MISYFTESKSPLRHALKMSPVWFTIFTFNGSLALVFSIDRPRHVYVRPNVLLVEVAYISISRTHLTEAIKYLSLRTEGAHLQILLPGFSPSCEVI